MNRVGRGAMVAVAAALILSGCSTGSNATGSNASGWGPSGADGELVGWGTVIESGPGSGEGLLCLSGVRESAPPQCTSAGVPVIGLEWPDEADAATVPQVRYFDGTAYGTWDGSALTLTRPFAVGDQSGIPADPGGAASGSADAGAVTEAMAAFAERAASDANFLVAFEGNGVVRYVVAYDDGSMQGAVDQEFGVGVVDVYSALRPA